MNNNLSSDPEFRVFLFSYRHDGAEWSFEIKARDRSDAEARVAKLQWARYDGEIIAVLPASLGWLGRIVVAVRQLFAAPIVG